MMIQKQDDRNTELHRLCASVRKYAGTDNYQKCAELICEAMGRFPHSPEPHNLFGIVLEKEGDHAEAMKHFRAAWALDPGYQPARQNMELYSTFYSQGKCAYDEDDCPQESCPKYVTEYDEKGIGHLVRRDVK
ncbi:MAG: hypothetical protein ACI4F3_04040 [Enterocloster sp.]